jgi:hypothetical protein
MNEIKNGFHTSCQSCKSCLRILLGELCVSVVINVFVYCVSFRLFLGEKKVETMGPTGRRSRRGARRRTMTGRVSPIRPAASVERRGLDPQPEPR